MKKTIFLICLSILLSCYFVNPKAYAQEQEIYTDSVLKFSLHYPSNWTLSKDKDGVLFKSPGTDFQSSAFLSLAVTDLSHQSMSLEEFMDQFERTLVKNGYHCVDKGYFSIGKEKVIFGRYEVDNKDSKKWELPIKAYGFIKGTTSYGFTYSAPVETFDQFLPIAEKIIQSYSEL